MGVDWTIDLRQARDAVGPHTALQGNLDPSVLFGSEEIITCEVYRILEAMRGYPHVFNLGHGIDQHTPISGVEAMIKALHQFFS